MNKKILEDAITKTNSTDIRIDDIGFRDLKLMQHPKEFCYGLDAVLLADFTTSNSKIAKRGDKSKEITIFDLGTGTGIIPLILSHKFRDFKNMVIKGVELQEKSAMTAIENIKLNNLEKVIDILNCNILDIDKKYYDTANIITTNPPYMPKSSALQNDNSAKTIARHETVADLDDFFKIASKLLKDKGELFMVHRPNRLVDLMALGRKYNLEGKKIQFISPKNYEIPNIVLIQYVKNGGKEITFLPTINVHNDDNSYTEEILKIYEK